MAYLARVLNIPARAPKGFFDGAHGAIDYPEQRLYCPHADDFYATPLFHEPGLSPFAVFAKPARYHAEKTRFEVGPGIGAPNLADYQRTVYERAKEVPAYKLIEAYWIDRIWGRTTLNALIETWGYDTSGAATAAAALRPRLQAFVDDFMARPENAGLTLEQGLEAYAAPIEAWRTARGKP
jgi:hypothetical protein